MINVPVDAAQSILLGKLRSFATTASQLVTQSGGSLRLERKRTIGPVVSVAMFCAKLSDPSNYLLSGMAGVGLGAERPVPEAGDEAAAIER
jgi:hypothetical protein